MNERDELGPAALGLRRYLLRVANALDSPAWCCEVNVPANAYVALEGGIPRYPDREMAALWDERDGWSVAIESPSGDDVYILAYIGEDVLASPAEVAAFVREFRADGYPGRPDPPGLRTAYDADGFEERLAAHVPSGEDLPDPPCPNRAGPAI